MSFTRKFYLADTHFNHVSILANCQRPFASVEEQEAALVARWNAVVRDGDLVYHLGDWGLPGADPMAFKRLFHALNGRKVLVYGNHDTRKDGSVHPALAALPWDQPPCQALEVRDGGRRVFLSHYAHRAWPARHHGAVHFYGHSHARLSGEGLSRDVGVDCADVDFTPRTFDELTKAWNFGAGKEAA